MRAQVATNEVVVSSTGERMKSHHSLSAAFIRNRGIQIQFGIETQCGIQSRNMVFNGSILLKRVRKWLIFSCCSLAMHLSVQAGPFDSPHAPTGPKARRPWPLAPAEIFIPAGALHGFSKQYRAAKVLIRRPSTCAQGTA